MKIDHNTTKSARILSRLKWVLPLFIPGLYLYFFSHAAWVTLDITVDTKSAFKIYWAQTDQLYSENRSVAIPTSEKVRHYGFYLTDLKDIRKLRIDPANQQSNVIIHKITISQIPFQSIHIDTPAKFRKLKNLYDVEHVEYRSTGMTVLSGGNDPQLELNIMPRACASTYFEGIFKALVWMMIAIGTWFVLQGVLRNEDYVTYALTFALALMIVMAVQSKFNQHPDEYFHLKAAHYYETNWVSPEICAPGTEDTYSKYGVSRLNSREIGYFYAGKFSSLLTNYSLENHLRLRFFNITLFCILLALALRHPSARIIFLPLAISSQIWYIFSYYNSDAFSMFSVYLCSYMVVYPKSYLYAFLKQNRRSTYLLQAAVLGALLASMLFVKKNYYFYILFLLAVIGVKYYLKELGRYSHLTRKLLMVVGIASVIVAIGYGHDIYVNGFDKSQKMMACRDELARPQYKPSTPLQEQFFGLNLKQKGVTVADMFQRYRWGGISFKSTFGIFGYMSIHGSMFFYRLIEIFCTLLFGVVAYTCLFKGGAKERVLFAAFVLCALLNVVASFWISWTVDLQRQGRYFLPIFAMSALLLYEIEGLLKKPLFNFLAFSLFLLSAYAFIFLGLLHIPKI